MAYVNNALPYQKEVLPPMLQSTTHPTINRFEISLDTSQDPFKFKSIVL